MASMRRKWFTTDGFDELNRIAKDNLEIELHKWQRESTARLLDGIDIALAVATGSGKSTVFQLYALAQPEEIVLVISPLKLLQRNMVFSIGAKENLNALAINADTISAANNALNDIWAECARGEYRVLLCAPEQLGHKKMKSLLENDIFKRHLGLVVVDEAHLIPLWGGDGSSVAFRSAFSTIRSLRSQLRAETVYLALSATLMPGRPTRIVKECLGFQTPNFELMREDCERTNLHFIFRRIARAAASTFPLLDWLIKIGITRATDIPKVAIYADGVMKGHKIVKYLRSLLPPSLQPQAHLIIRHIHASTCSQCKDEAADEFLKDGSLSLLRIAVATEAFGCGINIRDIRHVINYGTPHNINILLQRFGRNARDGADGFCYCYINAKYWDSIAKELGLTVTAEPKGHGEGEEGEGDAADEEDQRKPSDYCPYFKQLLEAHLQKECITHRVNILYENPTNGKPALCMRCSGCVDDQIPPTRPIPKRRRIGTASQAPGEHIPRLVLPDLRRVYKADFDRVQAQIINAAHQTWVSGSPGKSRQFGGVITFLPSAKSFALSRRLLDLGSAELIQKALGDDWKFWDTHGDMFATKILEIRTDFMSELKKEKGRNDSNDSSAESEDLEVSQPTEQEGIYQHDFSVAGPSRLGN